MGSALEIHESATFGVSFGDARSISPLSQLGHPLCVRGINSL